MGLISEYINKNLSANDLENELLKLISEYNKKRKTFLVVYAAAISKQVPAVALNMDDYYTLSDLLSNQKAENLDFYIETPGGSGETAEEIVRFLRKKFKLVNFLVSGEAKSAGTIMVLSSDEILMTQRGSLGPIDAQVKIGRSTQSAYDYMEWVKARREEAVKKGRLNPFDATMVAQISPGELNGVDNSLSFAQDLVVEWLQKYKFKNWKTTATRKLVVDTKMKEKRAKQIVEDIINHTKWRSHGRSIKIDDLEDIGLQIIKVDDDPQLSDIVYRIQTVLKLLFGTTNTYKVFATEKEKIFSTAVAVGAQRQIMPPNADVIQIDITCQNCKTIHKTYGKLASNPKIDYDMIKQGYTKFPADNRITCKCGFAIDIKGLKNVIETQTGKKLI